MRRSVERNSYYYNGSDHFYKKNADEYDLIPILDVPLLFLYQENESLIEVAWRIYQRLVSPFVSEKENAQNALIQWEEKWPSEGCRDGKGTGEGMEATRRREITTRRSGSTSS